MCGDVCVFSVSTFRRFMVLHLGDKCGFGRKFAWDLCLAGEYIADKLSFWRHSL